MVRTFIAVDIPDSLRKKMVNVQRELRGFDVRLVDLSQAHVTMKFLGEVSEEEIKPIEDALENMEFDSFPAKICNLGVFPNLNRIRIVWIGAEGDFYGLYEKIESSLSPFEFKKEKNFSSHITIGRVKKISNANRLRLAERIKEMSDVSIGEMNVDRIKLKKSTLTPNGPIYEDLYVKFPRG
jgi:2'-5' RNA ligase